MALIRKRTGNFLEDFRLGQVFRHKGGRTLTSGLIAHFTDFSFTANPLHKNRELARLYGYADMPVPPALVMVGEHDVLRDEVEAYAHKLAEAGVNVTSMRCLGTIHDFVMLNPISDTPAPRAAIQLACSKLNQLFYGEEEGDLHRVAEREAPPPTH